MAEYRKPITAEVTSLVEDTLVTGLGFTGSGFVGRMIEDKVKPTVDATSSTTDKLMAWGANNLPKAGIYFASKMLGTMAEDIGKAAAGSIAFDSVVRLANSGVNPLNVKFQGYRVMGNQATEQKLLQENQTLRTELNKAMQRLNAPHNEAMPFTNPTVNERQRKYGAMPYAYPTQHEARQKSYGFSASTLDTTRAGSVFGML